MTSDESKFTTLRKKALGNFGDNSKGQVIGIGNIGHHGKIFLENMWLVDKLKHNLISISQLCDKY